MQRALYRIVLTRLRLEERTQNYLERRTKDGKTKRETIRCLKRFVAREVYYLHMLPTLIPWKVPGRWFGAWRSATPRSTTRTI